MFLTVSGWIVMIVSAIASIILGIKKKWAWCILLGLVAIGVFVLAHSELFEIFWRN